MTPWIMPYHVEETASGLLVAPQQPTYGVSPLKAAYGAFAKAEAMMNAVLNGAPMWGLPAYDRSGLATEYPDLRDEFERKLAETPAARWAAEVGE